MTVVMYVDGSPKWTVSSLEGAMDLARPFAIEGHRVELVGRDAEDLHTWYFDQQSGSWLERRGRSA